MAQARKRKEAEEPSPNGPPELTISSEEIAAALRKYVEGFEPSMEREEVGQVLATGDGVATVEGLPRAMANELLEFPNGILGIAFNLDEDAIGCIVLGEPDEIEEGDPVKQTGRILSVGVGDGVLGRVITPTGVPLDGKGPIQFEGYRALEIQALAVASTARLSALYFCCQRRHSQASKPYWRSKVTCLKTSIWRTPFAW